jgi:hypothetical protein
MMRKWLKEVCLFKIFVKQQEQPPFSSGHLSSPPSQSGYHHLHCHNDEQCTPPLLSQHQLLSSKNSQAQLIGATAIIRFHPARKLPHLTMRSNIIKSVGNPLPGIAMPMTLVMTAPVLGQSGQQMSSSLHQPQLRWRITETEALLFVRPPPPPPQQQISPPPLLSI